MGLGTKYLGIGSTASTTYYEPFDVARRFQTVDHMLGGRAAWNVVTTAYAKSAAVFGRQLGDLAGGQPDMDARAAH